MHTISTNPVTLTSQRDNFLSRSKRRRARLLRGGMVALGVLIIVNVQAEDDASQAEAPQSRAGYSAGYAFGGQLAKLQRQSPGVELESVFRGILDALSGTEPRLSADERRAALQELERTRAAAAATGQIRRPRLRARSGAYVDDFAALNARREGVITLPSGVQYEVLQAGNGKRPGADDAVLVNYQGSLTTGAVFDSTYQDDEPARLQLAEIVVPGLKEALLLMNEGAKWRVVIPPQMGFKHAGNNMLRRRDLIYDIELVSVETSEEAPAAAPASQNTAPAPANAPPSPPATSPSTPATEQR
jgi:FKBP-type peptidyl-prolyl cis-trans isomerase FklB